MNYSRRSVLASTVALSVALAGCDSQDSPSDGSSSDGSSSDGGSSDGSGTNETTATATEGTRTFASPLARDTAAVFEEVVWYANHYNTTIYQYRGHVEDVEDLVETVRSESEVTESDLTNISSRTSTFHDFVDAEMASHFNKTSDISNTTNHYISQAEKFKRRRDEAALDDQLASLQRFYKGLRLDSFVQDRFSAQPIRRPLYTHLLSPALENENPVFVVGHPGRPFLRPCRLESSWEFDLYAARNLKTAEVQEYFIGLDFLFGGVDHPDGRADRIFVESFTKNGPRRSRPIYVQRYADATSAEDALSAIQEETTSEGTTDDLGRPTWHRVFFRHEIRMYFPDEGYAVYDVANDTVFGPDGSVVPETNRRNLFDRNRIQRQEDPERNVYVYVTRVGRHVIAAAPSTLAWEERPTGSENALYNTWLSDVSPGDGE